MSKAGARNLEFPSNQADAVNRVETESPVEVNPENDMTQANRDLIADSDALSTDPASGGTDPTAGIVPSTETVTLPGSQLVFVNTYASTVTDAYRTAILYAEHELESHFSNTVTVTVSFGFANLGANFLAQNTFHNAVHVSYAALKGALTSHATTADDTAAVATLPAADPSGGTGFLIAGGMARLLGLSTGAGSQPDVQLVLGSAFTWNFDPNNRGAANGYDAIGAIEHEISEGGFGRVGGLGYQNHTWGPVDLFRYSAPGQHDYTGGQDGLASYFSVDGHQLLTPFHNSVDTHGIFDGADPGDWEIGGDAFGYGAKGVVDVLSSVDLRVLDILGWTPIPATPVPTPTPAPTPVVVAQPGPTVHLMATSSIGAHPAGWLPAATGDFNHDGTSDLLWFNAANRDVDLWKISNGQWSGSADIGTHPAGYQPSASGDFSGDGTTDVLWYNAANGDAEVWKIANGQWAGSVDIGSHPAGWQPAGSGDFNGDGVSDVLWYNATNGDAEVWKIANGQWAGSVDIGSHPLGWQPVATGDFDHDGTSDVLWYNPATRDLDLWKVSNGHWAGSVDIGTHPAGYAPIGAGDFNGDGVSDVAWFNAASGDTEVWQIANGHWAGSVDLGPHAAGWSPVGIGDFNGDHISDIAWREASTGRIETWLLAYS